MASMNERERTGTRRIYGEPAEDPATERVQAIYEAAYPPAYPSAEPSEVLRRRVSEMAARRDERARRRIDARLVLRWALGGAALLILFLLPGWPGGRAPQRSAGPETRLMGRIEPTGQVDDGGITGRGGSSPQRSRPAAAGAVGDAAPSVTPAVLLSDRPPVRGGEPLQPAVSSTARDNGSGLLNAATTATARSWDRRGPSDWAAIEAQLRLSVRVRDDFVTIPFPRVAAVGDRPLVAAVEQYRREAAVTDTRLTREVSVQAKATAFVDLCERLRRDSGIQLVAGNSVADEKVTIFCKEQPLRTVMRQLSRPFGYTWLRSGKPGEYKYELVQDLKSQLLEEELRNRDRHQALLALEKEIERYRPYLHLSPDEAFARSETAPPQEKALLRNLSGPAWAALQMYSRLSPRDLTAMRSGQWVTFTGDPRPGQQPIPADLERGVIQVFRGWQVAKQGDAYKIAFDAPGAEPIPLAQAPGIRGGVSLTIQQSELGRVALDSQPSWQLRGSDGKVTAGGSTGDHSVAGMSPTVVQPDNAVLNARLERDPALRHRVSITLEGRYPTADVAPPAASSGSPPAERKVTSADVLEAFHQATGLPVVADYYTRLFKPETLSVRSVPRFDALNRLADGMRMRWSREGDWLQFRSTSYYDDRLKEVPNRLLARWAASRREHGALTLDDLVETAQLPDAQLDADAMGEGARDIWGLQEWTLPRHPGLRASLRFLAGFTPAQRLEAQSAAGLPFLKMPLAQQQRFLSLGLNSDDEPLESLDELAGATLRVDYSQPGWFQWGDSRHPGAGVFTRWVVPLEPGQRGRRMPRPPVRARTKAAVLEAVRQLDPQLRQTLLDGMRRLDPRLPAAPTVVEEEQVFPSQLDLTFVYIPGTTSPRPIRIQNLFAQYNTGPPM
jgi:hypothetical protein